MSNEIFKMSISNVRKLSDLPNLAELINTPNLRRYPRSEVEFIVTGVISLYGDSADVINILNDVTSKYEKGEYKVNIEGNHYVLYATSK